MEDYTKLSPDLIPYLGRQDATQAKLMALLAKGSQPDLNEQAKFIIAQDAFLTKNEQLIEQKRRAVILATRSEPVLVNGESGTGKELVAQILHGTRSGNFVAVNSTAVTETLFESELFGHVRGAFTGASESRAGLLTHAQSGTLFIDEIGDMPLSLQPKLLRVIQTRKFRVVGSNTDQEVKCRIVAATHMDLPRMVKEGKFRLDLYHRLNTFEINLTPIRKRIEDLPLFIREPELLAKLTNIYTTSPDSFLLGNIRELESIAKRWEVFGTI